MCSPASFETAYVQRASPTEPIVVTCPPGDTERVRAEDLARRELEEALERVARRHRGLEHVVGADHVHAHRPHRALEDGVDTGDRRAVDDVGRAERDVSQLDRGRARPPGGTRSSGGRRAGCRTARRDGGCRRDDLVLVDEAAGEGRADETGAAGDQDPFAVQSTRRVYRRATLPPEMRIALALCLAGRRRRLRGRRRSRRPTPRRTDLKITVWPGAAAGETQDYTLRCARLAGRCQGGAACTQLADADHARSARPGRRVCTEQYGGPQQARHHRQVEAAASGRSSR